MPGPRKDHLLVNGDCLDVLKRFVPESIDSLVTDPPAGISFMGKEWDEDKGGRKEWIAWMSSVMQECLRVLKPGAHALVWAIPRTSHWTATALEDAGFEIRDVVTHLFGSGFPKSLNVGKQTGLKEHEGIGTALKPASEHWILARKPLAEKTATKNVLEYGTGGLNIDASRIAAIDAPEGRERHGGGNSQVYGKYDWSVKTTQPQGRFPANLVLSHNDDCVSVGSKKVKGDKRGSTPEGITRYSQDTECYGSYSQNIPSPAYGDPDGTETVDGYECTEGCAVAELDRQSGVSKSPTTYTRNAKGMNATTYSKGMGELAGKESLNFGDAGGASRFFYCAKASKREKNAGVELNSHPTVKSTRLMSYLIKLVTPPEGVVLDPFTGSGSTGVAAIQNGFKFIGIERESDYVQIANKRIFHAFPEFKKDLFNA